MKKISITITEQEARLLRALLARQTQIHRRNALTLQRGNRFKVGGYITGDRERQRLAEQAKQQLINVHENFANEFSVILENISGRMFQKGIKFDPINFLKTKILK